MDAPSARVLALFDDYHDRVYRFVRKTLDEQSAHDIVQDVFLRLLAMKDLERKHVSASYLVKIADNLVKRRYRTAVRAKRLTDSLSLRADRSTPPQRAPHDTPLDDSDLRHLNLALTRLSDDEHASLRFIVGSDMSYQHAALALDVPPTTVNNWKHRALRKLHDHSFSRDFTDAEPRSHATSPATPRTPPRSPARRTSTDTETPGRSAADPRRRDNAEYAVADPRATASHPARRPAISRDAIGRDAIGRPAISRDSVGRDAVCRAR